jgi:hypothetical protein
MLFRFKFAWNTYVDEGELKNLESIIGAKIEYEERKLSGEKPYRPEKTLELRSWNTFTGDVGTLIQEFPDIVFEVVGVIDNSQTENRLAENINLMNNLTNKVEKLLTAAERMNEAGQSFNAKCQVNVPGLGLLSINEVTWEEDFCTERLQDKLEEGWRILAICPQPDQRRPDYILGRNKDAQRDY